MAKICQIGAGMVGQAMALDLAKNHDVYLADFNQTSLDSVLEKNNNIHIQQLDVTQENQVSKFVKTGDIVLLAVPGFMGYLALKSILKCGKNVVDISFSPENVLDLSQLAIEKGVTAIVDAGVAPGIPNYLLGFHHSKMKIDSFEYYVGGLPKNPIPPFNYKAPFSPIDVIEEYIRPARMMVNSEIITKPALSDIEIIDFQDAGKLEAFNTDGLRSILSTMNHIPNMKEKTLRYPGHAALMQSYCDQGKFSPNQITKTSSDLFADWKLEKDEAEFTILDVIIKGEGQTIHYHLYDEFDIKSGIASMSRTTGYTATASINLILNKLFDQSGVFPPETVGEEKECTAFISSYLKERNISLIKTIQN